MLFRYPSERATRKRQLAVPVIPSGEKEAACFIGLIDSGEKLVPLLLTQCECRDQAACTAATVAIRYSV